MEPEVRDYIDRQVAGTDSPSLGWISHMVGSLFKTDLDEAMRYIREAITNKS